MSSGARSLPPPQHRSRREGRRELNIKTALLPLLLALLFVAGGCSHGPRREFSAKEAVTGLQAQAAEVKTVRGRAFISARTPEAKASFPAIVAIDRTNPTKPSLRIEAMDPLGSTHILIILTEGRELTWLDYDRRERHVARGSWNGLPLAQLPELLTGLAPFPENGKVAAAAQAPAGAEGTSFQVRSALFTADYLVDWVSESQLSLHGIDVTRSVRGGTGADKYSVRYSRFEGQLDHYLPRESVIKAESATGQKIDVEISWRERKWNEEISAEAFKVPRAGSGAP